MNTYTYETTLGSITIQASDSAITSIIINHIDPTNTKETPIIKEAIKQIDEYLKHTRKDFTIKLEPIGTPHQHKVWEALKKIPYSQTKTYKDVAIETGNINASRAIGNACNKNPIMIMIPCHRVIGTNGKLTGYAGGLDIKEILLELEQTNLDTQK